VAFRQALSLSKQAADMCGGVLATERLAQTLQQQHYYADAINELQKALSLADSASMPEEKASIFLDLSDCYAGSGKKDKAIFYGKIGLGLTKRYRLLNLQERAHLILHLRFKELGNSAEALDHYKAYVSLRDRLANDIRNRQLTEMRLRYRNEKIAKEIAVLTREKRIQELDLARKQNLIWSALGVIALLGTIALILQRKNQVERSTNAKLQTINTKIEQQRDKIEQQKSGLKDALGQLESSIQYAKRIQDAILAASAPLAPAFLDPVLYFRPKAIVSGDFYWVSHQGDESVLVVADCTGHGVPGAFLSLVGHSTLVRALAAVPNLDPAEILTFIDQEISRILGNQPGLDLKEGIEMSVCVVDRKKRIMRFAGARRDALVVVKNEVETLAGSRRSVGGVYARRAPENWKFETQCYPLPVGATVYLLSDGLTDQHSSEGNLKFGLPRLRSLLKEIAKQPAYEQTRILDHELATWRGDTEQTDDILLVGIKVA
jgi:serine phosphatase RsbU (regulator of sigma subunit)